MSEKLLLTLLLALVGCLSPAKHYPQVVVNKRGTWHLVGFFEDDKPMYILKDKESWNQ